MAMAQATTTIAAPLWFYADKGTDSVTAAEFMKEAKARVAGNPNITTDAHKITFVAGCLRGTALHWWNTLARTKPDYDINTWAGFLACFAEEFCVPVSKPGTFDPTEICRQKQGELPRRYFQRIAQYFCDKLPLSPYAKETDISNAAATAATALLAANPAPDAAAIAAAIAAQVQKTVEASLLEMTDHQIRQILSLIHI